MNNKPDPVDKLILWYSAMYLIGLHIVAGF